MMVPPEAEFTVNSLDELRDCLHRVNLFVHQGDVSSTSVALVAQKLRAIARDTLAYSKTLSASVSDRRDDEIRIQSAMRKSRMVRLVFEGFTGGKVAGQFGVLTTLVSQHAHFVLRMLKYRLNHVAKVEGRTNPLLDLGYGTNAFKQLH